MKKLIALILALAVMLPIAASAELPKLDDLSLEELQTLRVMVCNEILQRSEWGEVTVPPGFYVVGEDIPVGHWTIKYAPDEICIVEYFNTTDETGKKASYKGEHFSVNIGDPSHKLSKLYDNIETDIELKEGYYIIIKSGPAIFVPFAGRTSPFFK